MPPPTREELEERARQATRDLHEEATVPDPDRTYKNEIRKYKEWVAEQREEEDLPEGPRYITRENVDCYFAEIVARRMVKPETARRVVNALQWMADKDEYLGEEARFVIDDSQRVEDALLAQALLYQEHVNGQVVDPHKNVPTRTLTMEERKRVITTILSENRQNWMNMCLSWTGCECMMTRNDSMRKFRLCDLHALNTHGPCFEGPYDRRMMGILYHKGRAHKERQTKTREVGCYRHKDFVLCFTGMLAMTLFVRLFADGTMNFYDGMDENEAPQWWSKKLIEGWSSYKAAFEAYTEILDYLDISWEKVCHLRKAGTEYASSVGRLRAEVIATMTKHVARKGSNRFQEAYNTELYPPIMLVMSGFKEDDDYFNPRTRVDVKAYCRRHGRDPVDFIFPRRFLWKQEQESDGGDKSKAATAFLDEALPFLAEVAIQDGIYWIEKFPNHPASLHLLHVMPADFPQFAATARAWVREQIQGLDAQRLSSMTNQTQQAFTFLGNRLVNLEQQSALRHYELLQKVEQQNAQILQLLQQQQPQAPDNDDDDDYDDDGNGGGDDGDDDDDGGEIHFCTDDTPKSPVRRLLGRLLGQKAPKKSSGAKKPASIPIPAATVPQAQQHQVQQLRHVPYVPPFPTAMPKTWKDLAFQHAQYGLSKYQSSNKLHWPNNVRNAFSKRAYLYHHLERKANRMHGDADLATKIPLAAAKLDDDRKGISMHKIYRQLKSVDPTTKKRQSKKGV